VQGKHEIKILTCCEDCYENFGYLNSIRVGDAEYYASRFKKDIGFWRAGVGCILQREKRSSLCISYVCECIVSKLLPIETAVLYMARPTKTNQL
jgi:hypothetical protein